MALILFVQIFASHRPLCCSSGSVVGKPYPECMYIVCFEELPKNSEYSRAKSINTKIEKQPKQRANCFVTECGSPSSSTVWECASMKQHVHFVRNLFLLAFCCYSVMLFLQLNDWADLTLSVFFHFTSRSLGISLTLILLLIILFWYVFHLFLFHFMFLIQLASDN